MFCPVCGRSLKADELYCEGCGALVAKFSPQQARQMPMQPSQKPVQPPRSTAPPPAAPAAPRPAAPPPAAPAAPRPAAPPPAAPAAPRPAPKAEKKEKSNTLLIAVAIIVVTAVIVVAMLLLFQPKEAQSIRLLESRIHLAPGQYAFLDYEILPADTKDQTVTWSTSDPAVATVDNGEICATGEGTCEITVRSKNGMYDRCTVIVSEIAVLGVEPIEPQVSLYVGQTKTLTYRILPEGALTELTWVSSDASVATVKAGGQVTAVGLGTCYITLTAANGITGACQITVSLREEEALVFGTWYLVKKEQHFDGGTQAASGMSLQLKDDLTGIFKGNGEDRPFTWHFSQVDADGDHWYASVEEEDELQFLYYPTTGELAIYGTDESLIFRK